MADHDAVIVGSGINSLACGALLARARLARVRARAERLARRRDPDGRADRARVPPRRLQRVASALGRRRRARAARRRARGARPRVPEHRAADRDGVSRRRGRVPAAHRRGQRAASSARSGRACSSGSSRTPTSRSACSAPSSGRRPGLRSARRRCAGSGGTASPRSRASCCRRAATGSSRRSRRSARTGCSRRGCCTPASAPTPRRPGFMTQVIAVAVQEGGMPIPRGGGAKLADALVQLIRDHGGTCETGVDVERVLVQSGRAVGVRTAGGETVTAERAVIANVTPTQLYERLLDETRRAGARARRREPLPLRPLRDADPLRALRAGALAGRRAAERHRDRPRHAGPRRRLACGERGGARAAARRGDDRRRPAAHDRPVARARRQGAALDPAAGAAVARQGRRRRRARRRRRHLVGRPARAVRGPHPGAARAAHPEPRVEHRSSASCSRPPTSSART